MPISSRRAHDADHHDEPRGGAVIIIQADQVRPGDIVEYHGERHLVCDVQRRHGAAWAIACDGSGWAIALGRQPLRVRRAVATLPAAA
jgi:transposase